MGTPLPGGAIVRIFNEAGQVVGTGFLATRELVLTCAHVLGTARPAGPVTVDFPLLGGDRRVTAYVVAWHAGGPGDGGDIAVLRLTDVPSAAEPGRLVSTPTRWGEQVRVFGFPPDLGAGRGVWAEAELRAVTTAGWLQLESALGRRRVGRGFSGSPVYSPAAGGVVGMVVATERGTHTTTSYALAVGDLLAAHPDIAAPDPGEVCPYRGLEPFYEEHAEWFGGREALTARLREAVDARPLVVVAGPSGSGKSSLVHAGLVPAVRRGGKAVVSFRMRAGEPALTSLARALSPVLSPELGEQARLVEAESLAGRLATAREQTLPWLAARLWERAGPGGLLIFVDQFEEAVADRLAEARELFDVLAELAAAAKRCRDGSPAVAVVVTLRSGALDELVTDRTAAAVEGGVVFVRAMTREQLAAAVSPDGVRFEPGLVDRILADAGTEPGTLPLVEFALVRLWEERVAGTLTHFAYTGLGGVAGALAGYAEACYGRLTTFERDAARRLLLALARPDPDGGFLRRPLRLSDVDDTLLPVLARLSAARLVVVGRTGDGMATVELAHQALLRQWPRLRGWLAAERELLAWREQLRYGMGRWHADDRDPGGLLRGAPLARAVEWLAADVDLSASEREYIALSRARARRRVRVWRGVVAVIVVLALVAGGFAAWAGVANQRMEEQLRIAHSRALADDSARFRVIDPAMSLQLAQAAWHTAPTPEAYGALLTQFLGLRQVDKMFHGLWSEGVHRVMASEDGSRVTFARDDGWADTWVGLTGDRPSRSENGPLPRRFTGGTFQLSPSGRLLAYDNGAGTVAFWDRDQPGTVMLRDAEETARVVRSMAFAPDETKLLIARSGLDGRHPEFELWDLTERRTIPVADDVGPDEIALTKVFFGPAPNTMVVAKHYLGVAVYDLTTGALLRAHREHRFGGSRAGRHGAVMVECLNPLGQSTLVVVDVATGTQLRNVPVPGCEFEVDSSTNFALLPTAGKFDVTTVGQLLLVDLATGTTYELTTPPIDLYNNGVDERGLDAFQDKIVVLPGSGGRPVALVANDSLLYQMRPAEVAPTKRPTLLNHLVDPQGRYGVAIRPSGTVELADLASQTVVASVPGAQICRDPCGRGQALDFTPDGEHLLVVRDDSLVVHSVPALTVEARIPLPVPQLLGGPPDDDGEEFHHWSSSLRFLADDQVTVLHAGVVTRWRLTDHRQVGTPTPVRSERDGLRRSAHGALLELRPAHPDEAVVVQPGGDVELWNLDQHRRILTMGRATTYQGAVRFTPDGNTAAVHTDHNEVQLWDVAAARERGRPIPGEGRLLGFTPDGKLVTVVAATGPFSSDSSTAHIWDHATGKRLANATWPAIDPSWSLQDGQLTMRTQTRYGTHKTWSLRLDPTLWAEALCDLHDRDFTRDEHTLLTQLGASHDRPCG